MPLDLLEVPVNVSGVGVYVNLEGGEGVRTNIGALDAPPPGKISGSVHASVCFVPEEKSMSCLLTGAP